MRYEAHVTVAPRPCSPHKFRQACVELGAKAICIELFDTKTLTQPMTSYTFEAKNDEDAKYIARKQAIELYKRGFKPTRLKLEVEPSERKCLYHETHIKVAFEPDDPRLQCDDFGDDYKDTMFNLYGARLSKNSWSKDETRDIRFFTIREYGTLASLIIRALQFKWFLLDNGYPILRIETETAIYDTNIKLDAGWLDEPREGPGEQGT